MAVTMVVEDGTGISNANSYTDLVFADQYNEDRGRTDWAALSDDAKSSYLITGTTYLENFKLFPWRGSKKTYAQGLQWPRTGASENHGQPVPDDAVPTQIMEANCELSFYLSEGNELQPPSAVTPNGVKQEKVDVLSTTYFSPSEMSELTIKDLVVLVPSAMGLVWTLLRDKSSEFLEAVPYMKALPQRTTPTVDRPLFAIGDQDNQQF